MDFAKMARGNVRALRDGAEEELANGNRLQASLLFFLAGDKRKALELAVQDDGAYPLMETQRGLFVDRLKNADNRTEITYLARYYFGADANISRFMRNVGLG